MTDIYEAYDSAISKTMGGTDALMNKFNHFINQQKQAAEKQKREGEKQLKAQQDKMLRSEYVRSNRNMANLPQQTALVGGGGVAETSILNAQSDYTNARNEIVQSTLEQIRQLYDEIDKRLNDSLSSYYATFADYIADREKQAEDKERWQEEFDYKKAQDALKNQQATYKAATAKYTAAAADDQAEEEKVKTVKTPTIKEKNQYVEQLYNRAVGTINNYLDRRAGYSYIDDYDFWGPFDRDASDYVKKGRITVDELDELVERITPLLPETITGQEKRLRKQAATEQRRKENIKLLEEIMSKNK